MKITLIAALALTSAVSFAKEVKDFNKVLIEGVQRDLKTDNAEELKVKSYPSRGPASVAVEPVQQEETKLDKNHRQLGNSKW